MEELSLKRDHLPNPAQKNMPQKKCHNDHQVSLTVVVPALFF